LGVKSKGWRSDLPKGVLSLKIKTQAKGGTQKFLKKSS